LILGIINDKKYATKFQTFSAVFKEEKFSEKKYIDKFETDNIELKKHFIYPKPEELKELIEELVYTQEEPFRSLAIFSQYNIYKHIKNNTKTKVLLNGQGADEIFTGYTEYYFINLIELLKSMNFKRFFHEFNSFKNNRDMSSLSVWKQIFSTILSNKFRRTDKYKIFNKQFKTVGKKQKFDSLLKNSLWNSLTFSALREYLRYEDKNSMRFSLESRLPFLDFKLVQSAFSLKNENKINNGLSKVVLRDIAKDKIPNETLNRKDKMGFVSPQEVWQKTILKDEFDSVFKDIKKNGLFDFMDSARIGELYDEYKNNKMNDWALIWNFYIVYKWKKTWNIKG
jgi:asparagine synthase (glutamine-hydrolysing)